MPKVVDHTSVRKQIAAASWRVLLREGMKGLTVRAVASELQLSVGMLRHYFPKQDELLLFSMELVIERASERLKHTDPAYTPYEKLQYAAWQFLPLDADRTLEMEVWLQFITGARNKTMQDIRAETQQRIRAYFTELIVQAWQAEGIDQPRTYAEYCAQVLHALVDGLTLRYLALPSESTKREIIATTERQLRNIVKGAL